MITYLTLKKKGITDFASARNELLKTAKTEWVMFVDTDEEITPELQVEINETINKVPNLAGYYIKRKIYFVGKLIGEDKVLRLAKRNAGKWERAVHEIWNVKGDIGEFKNYMIHNTAASLSEYINKINKYSTLHAQENLKEGKKSNLFKIIFYPTLKFTQNFGMGRGFVFSLLQAFHSFLAWSQMWILIR